MEKFMDALSDDRAAEILTTIKSNIEQRMYQHMGGAQKIPHTVAGINYIIEVLRDACNWTSTGFEVVCPNMCGMTNHEAKEVTHISVIAQIHSMGGSCDELKIVLEIN